MRTEDFDYHLPEEQIAQRPLAQRDESRLLLLGRASGRVRHRSFRELPQLLARPSLLVVNDTRVFPARLIGSRSTGGQVELLLLRKLEERDNAELWECMGKPRRRLRPGTEMSFGGGGRGDVSGTVTAAEQGEPLVVELRSATGIGEQLAAMGRVPLPPYIRRDDDGEDRHRYQTIFAGDAEGSVAAPTAGLHFTSEVVAALRAGGHRLTSVTLHVGPGTFRPVRAATLAEHRMDGERYEVSEEAAAEIADARAAGRPVIAVGTTVVRTLESAARADGTVEPRQDRTELFIVPGHEFRVVEGLLTNFHLPRSTLLALVSALAGRRSVLSAYGEAVQRGYRFYSYGDAMLIQ